MFYRGGTLSSSESVILIPDADALSDMLELFKLPETHNFVLLISVLNVLRMFYRGGTLSQLQSLSY